MEKRKYATYDIEEGIASEGYKYIAGVDEVGRGPGAGPIVAAAVIIPVKYLPNLMGRVRDSKTVSEIKREYLYHEITEECRWAVGRVDSEMIDALGIGRANQLAMELAINQIPEIDYLLIDGRVHLDIGIPELSIIKGDSKSISIAAASIVAKVTRDEEMRTLHWIYPEYDWISNKGYLTKKHIDAIRTYGITDHHRKSFRKVGDV